MRNIKKKLVVFGILNLIFCGILCNPVSASSNVSLDAGWEGEAHGSSDGNSGKINYDHMDLAENKFFVSSGNPIYGLMSFNITGTGTGNDGKWVVTEDYTYVSDINLTYNYTSQSGAGVSLSFKFQIGDTIYLWLKWKGNVLKVKEAVTGDRDIETTNDLRRLHIKHNGTNEFWFRFYNDADVLQTSDTCYGYIADTWTTFEKVIISDGGTSTNLKYQFDGFDVTTDTQVWEAGNPQCSDENNRQLITRFWDDPMVLNESVMFDIWDFQPTKEYRAYIYDEDTDSEVCNWNTETRTYQQYVWESSLYYDSIKDSLNFSIRTKYKDGSTWGSSSWFLICPFSISGVIDPDDIGSWNLRLSLQDVWYNTGSIKVEYKTPDVQGVYGDLYTIFYEPGQEINDSDYTYYTSVSCPGDDWCALTHSFAQFGLGKYYSAQLRNNSNSSQRFTDTIFIPPQGGDLFWSLFVNDEFTCSVYAQQKVRIAYNFQNSNENVYINIYNHSSYGDDYLVHSWNFGSGSRYGTLEWFPANYSVGTENFYVTLYGEQSERQIFSEDGIDRIVSVFDIDEDITDPPTPPIPPGGGGGTHIDGFTMMLGACISIGVGLLALYYVGDGIAFAGVTIPMVFILSRQEMMEYQMFPEVVGYALVGAMVLGLFFYWWVK